MISKNQEARRDVINTTLLNLLYRKLMIQRELEDIDKRIMQIEGAMNENEALRRDVNTQAALDANKPKEESGNA